MHEAQFLRELLRCNIVGPDRGRHRRRARLLENPVDHAGYGFKSESAPAPGFGDAPTDFDVTLPVRRSFQVDRSDHRVRIDV